jgi:hypothetical protein
MRKPSRVHRVRKPSASSKAPSVASQAALRMSPDNHRKIRKLLTAKSTKGVVTALLLLESLGATQQDYQAIFTDKVIRGVVRDLDAETLLATSQALLPHKEVCKQFIAAAAERFCKATEPVRLRLLHGLFHQPFCFVAWHADPAKHRLDLDVSDGTVLWDVLHRELLAAKRVKMRYRHAESDSVACVVHSLNGIHLAGYYHDRGEGRPDNLPNHVVQACDYPASEWDWIEVAWAVSFENMIGGVLRKTTELWDSQEICFCGRWGRDPDVIIAMLWSWFTAECLSGSEIAHLNRWHLGESTPLLKRRTLFHWTDEGLRALVSYARSLLRQRTFSTPETDEALPSSPYLPWQQRGDSWENDLEARWKKGQKHYASYAAIPDGLKRLACYAAIAVRDAAQRMKPLTNGVPVIEGLANHTLICLALHPATPRGIVQLLADDAYEPVASAATAGRTAKSDQRSPADNMKELVDYVVRGTGGRTRVKEVPDSKLAVAKRLARYWTRWKKEDSLDDVDAINTEDPRANENRMRAVAMGVAVTRGWIVPTKEGVSLMNKCVEDLDNPSPNTGSDAEDDDDD